MIFVNGSGYAITWAASPADTAAQTICTGTGQASFQLESFRVSCDGTSTAFSLWLNDGTDDHYLNEAKSVGANDVYQITDHQVIVPNGWSLKCSAGTGAHLSFTAVILKVTANK